MDYQGRNFRSVSNTPNGEVSAETIFHYQQVGNLVTANYSGGGIIHGQLIALMEEDGCLDMRYHHVNIQGELQTGICRSTPELLADGRIRLHETWRWTSGNGTSGQSVVEEFR